MLAILYGSANRPAWYRMTWWLPVALIVVCLAVSSCAREQGQVTRLPPPDHVVPGFHNGIPVVMRSFEIRPGAPIMVESEIPDTMYRQVMAYIVGIADPVIGASPHIDITLPNGAVVVMPAHQAVLPCLDTPDDPSLGIAYSVIPGPAATAHNLRTDAMPERSVIGAALASAILIGPSWVPLTGHVPIEYGLHKQILQLRFFGVSPVGWATPDWSEGYPYMPEMVRACDYFDRPPPQFLAPQDPQWIVPAH